MRTRCATWVTGLLVCSLSRVAFAADVVINEVRYDPPGSDAGGEYVELYNVSAQPIVLDAAWHLERGNGASPGAWTTFWTGEGTLLERGAWIAIGDDPRAALAAVPALQNGPDACRLVHAGGVEDLVGWGSHTYAEYVESSGAEDPADGVIARRPDGADTDDNHADFVHSTRETPGALNFPDRLLLIEPAFPPTDPAVPEPGEAFDVRAVVRAAGLETLEPNGAGVQVAGDGARWVLDRPLPPGGVREVRVRLDGLAGGEHVVTLTVFGDGLEREAREVPLRVGTGPLIVSEIQPRARDEEPEWIELEARGAGVADLAGWRLVDAGGGEVVLPSVPGGRLVVTSDGDRLLGLYPEVEPGAVLSLDLPTLNDRDEVIHVVDPSGRLSDAVAFDAPPVGESLERVHPDLPSRDPAAWVVSPFGPTPQRQNGAFTVPPVEAHTFTITPRVVGAHGVEIGFHLGEAVGHVTLIVADTAGRERGCVLERDGSGQGGVRWDGRLDGERLTPGLYVLVARVEREGRVVEARRAFAVGWGER